MGFLGVVLFLHFFFLVFHVILVVDGNRLGDLPQLYLF